MKRTLLLLVTCLMLFCWPQRAMAELETAVFAGGCFWCMEHDLEDLPGVRDAVSGYSGGHVDRPSYRQVSSETTGHQEAVQVRFDPEQISYAQLLRSYWRNVDPLDGGAEAGGSVLACRGLSPELRREQRRQIQLLPVQLWPRSPPRQRLGRQRSFW